ncbi:hypothetical protein [Nocardioides mangrovi]|uniref:Secreted protein n=1 Tax=Nocardioides mangrovi TaxID=2874580 RepID=A0ABS7U9L7_9ACTN|nr:hypothetical protein [Nocardioides mangrovi]MBZ5737674.1 hypothetical protein [Nocardioides mangrovi]
MKTLALTAAALLTLPALALTVAPAHAGDADRVRTGSCSGSTDWKIKAGPDDGRMEVEAEIDSNRAGQTWHWVLKRNGSVVDRGVSMTRGRSGSFDVERRTADGAGTDSFRFRAVNRASGETCVARVSR